MDKLSIRLLSKRLGVSHQAPYKHFANKQELVAVVMQTGLDGYCAQLQQSVQNDSAKSDLYAMCRAHLDFAIAQPHFYQLLFLGDQPNLDIGKQAQLRNVPWFNIYRRVVMRMVIRKGSPYSEERVDLATLILVSAMQGLGNLLLQGKQQTNFLQQHSFDLYLDEFIANTVDAI